MKKLSYFASLLILFVGSVSCQENIEPPQPQLPDEYRQVTITAGSAQTRTSVSGGILTWSANDKLNIVPQAGSVAAATLSIKSGVGEATGTFEGSIDASITDGTALYGWCGGNWTYNSGTFSVDMPASQTYVANGLAENSYPSIGTGSITSGMTLSNPMGVLKLTVKGETTELVKSISVTSAANNLAGAFTVNPASSYAVSGGSAKTLTLNVASPYVALSPAGVNFYIVLPPAGYAANDLTVTVTKSDDTSFSNTFADVVTVTANNATAKEVKEAPAYLCFEALQANSSVDLSGLGCHPTDIVYSTDGCDSWNALSAAVTLEKIGDKCYIKTLVDRKKITANFYGIYDVDCAFAVSGNLKVSGNIMTLLNGENPSTTMTSDYAGCFKEMFKNCTAITDASELVLPATTLAANCYAFMFSGCTNLTSAPNLPATTLAANCYDSMFKKCESLSSAPTISATTLASQCCYGMFSECTSLTAAPALPATTLEANCYGCMFSDCTNLTTAPNMSVTAVAEKCCDQMFLRCSKLTNASNISLAAATLADNCFYGMFCDCVELKYAPTLSATTAAIWSCDQMFSGCSKLADVSNITFATTVAEKCYHGMFEGCQSLESVPELPATTLEASCYGSMFSDCTNLTTAPNMSVTAVAENCCGQMFMRCSKLTNASNISLAAATLADKCFNSMFCDCAELKYAPTLSATTAAIWSCDQMFSGCSKLADVSNITFATTVAEGCYLSMFKGCQSLESVPELPAVTLATQCYHSMFRGCVKLSSVTMMATDISATECLVDWLEFAGTSASSRIVNVASGMVDAVKATVPNDWKSGVQVKP